jgi:hypothetical protein
MQIPRRRPAEIQPVGVQPLRGRRPFGERVARLIQFRSELAILAVLGGGVAVGAAVRQVLPVPKGPSAISASPLRDHREYTASPTSRTTPRPPKPASPQAVDPR